MNTETDYPLYEQPSFDAYIYEAFEGVEQEVSEPAPTDMRAAGNGHQEATAGADSSVTRLLLPPKPVKGDQVKAGGELVH